jgi:AcrR family transcriptional regulator
MTQRRRSGHRPAASGSVDRPKIFNRPTVGLSNERAPFRTRREEQAAGTRQAIVQVARALFAERGYADTSIDEITRQTRTARGAFYHHFASKEELFRQVVGELEAESTERILAAAATRTAPWEQLEAGCQAFLDACMEPGVQRIVLLDGPAVLKWGPDENAQGTQLMRAWIEGLFGPSSRAFDAESLAAALLGALDSMAKLIVRSTDPRAARERARDTISQLLKGLAAQSKPARAR